MLVILAIKELKDGAWINQYNSIFCILNERGEIINWQFTKSEGFDEVKDMFLDIKERSKDNGLELICIDNCCKWSSLLTDGCLNKTRSVPCCAKVGKNIKKERSCSTRCCIRFWEDFSLPSGLG